MAESVQLETWKSVIRGRQEVVTLLPGGVQGRKLIQGGKDFTLTPVERDLTEQLCKTDKVNPFKNGMFVRKSVQSVDVAPEDLTPPAPAPEPYRVPPTATEPVQLTPAGDGSEAPREIVEPVPASGVIPPEVPPVPGAVDAAPAPEPVPAPAPEPVPAPAPAPETATELEPEPEPALTGGQPAALVENQDDVDALDGGAAPDAITDEQIDELLGSHWKQATKRISEMTAPWTLRRVHERAVERQASDAVKNAITERLAEIGEPLTVSSQRTVMPPIEPLAEPPGPGDGPEQDPRFARPPGDSRGGVPGLTPSGG